MKKPRVLIVSAVVPAINGGGGRLALHRHFTQREDVICAVVSRFADQSSCKDTYTLKENRLVKRLKRSAISRVVNNLELLTAPLWTNGAAMKWIKDWKPDLVFTVADDWHSQAARKIASRLGIPLVVDFQDIFCLSNFTQLPKKPYGILRPLLVRRFRALQRNARAVFHTSQGMKDWFGVEKRGEVLYPIGEQIQVEALSGTAPREKPLIVYAGNCYGPYGEMLLRLSHAVKKSGKIGLRIFTMGNDWPEDLLEEFSNLGIYKGYRPFAELHEELLAADGFLTAMSFKEVDRTFVSTSFTTKWLDYAPFAKPIFVWAPEYSSAAEFSRRTNAGIVVSDPDPDRLIETILETRKDPGKWVEARESAKDAAENDLNSERIHAVLLRTLDQVLNQQDSIRDAG